LACIVATAAVLVFALSAWQQVTVWRGTISLYQNLLGRLEESPCRARFDEILGWHYLKVGLTNEAVTSFQNVLYYASRRKDQVHQEYMLSRTHTHLGDVCAGQARYNEAWTHYRTALALDPGSVAALINLGSMLIRMDRDAEAIKCFEDALRCKPDSPEAHHNLVVVLRKIGRDREALEHFHAERRLLAGKSL